MKKILLNFLMLFSLALTFTSCDIENDIIVYPSIYGYSWQPYQMNGAGQYSIGGYSTGQNTRASRAAVSQTYDDKFSLWSWTADSTVMDNYHGVFSTDPNSGNPTWGYTEQVKYFDNFVPEYNFLGVIPQSTAHVYDATNHTVTVAADTFTVASTDLTYKDDREILYAATTVQRANYATGASMAFNNLNAKVYFKFESDDPNTQILDFTPYTPGTPEVPATPGTTTTKSGKALDMLYAGEIVYWPYAGDANLTSTQANNFYKNTTNYGSMGDLMDVVNAQFVYYNTSGSVTTNAWAEGNKKDMYGVQLAASTNKDDFVGGATEDTWKDAFWTNASAQLKDVFRTSYAAGWRVVRIDHIAGTQYDAWLMNNTEMTYKVITGGTPYQPAVPASGHKGIILLPATSVNGTGTDAVLSTFPASVNATLSLNGVTWETTATGNSVTFEKPTGNAYTTAVQSPTAFFTFPASVANTANLGYTVKLSYEYKGVKVYDARVFIPADKCNWQSAKYYTYTLKITGRGNGKSDPSEADEDDPVIPATTPNNQIVVNSVTISGYAGEEWKWENGNDWVKEL